MAEKKTKTAVKVKKSKKTEKTKTFKNSVKGKKEITISATKMAMLTRLVVVEFLVIAVLGVMLTAVVSTKSSCTPEINSASDDSTEVVKDTTPKRFATAIAPSDENGNIGDRVMGKSDSKATVIMYVDMQCPACAQMMPIYKRIYEKYKDQATFIVRYYIITSHVYARLASIAVEAAAQQGYYWEMLNEVFSSRSEWAYVDSDATAKERMTDIFKKISDGNGDADRFVSDLGNETLAKKVDFDWGLGKEDNINATPTIIVNSVDVDFSNSDKSVSDLVGEKIEEALK